MSLLSQKFKFLRKKNVSPSGHQITEDGGREWENFYRDRWSYDKVVRTTHGVNCTGSCSWNIYVKNGVVAWENQATDYPETPDDMPDYEQAKTLYTAIHQLIQDKVVISAYTLGFGGVAAAVSKMAFGNKLGAKIDSTVKAEDLFKTGEYGCMIAEVPADALDKVNMAYTLIGEVTDNAQFTYGDTVVTMDEALKHGQAPLKSLPNTFRC